MKRTLCLGLMWLMCVLGCGKQTAPQPTRQTVQAVQASSPQATTTQVVAVQPVQRAPVLPDPKVVEFRKKMAAFVEEASSLARYLGDVPELRLYAQKLDTVTDSFSRVPDPPPGFEGVHRSAKDVLGSLQIGKINTALLQDFLVSAATCEFETIRQSAKKSADESLASCRKLSLATKQVLQQIEMFVGKP